MDAAADDSFEKQNAVHKVEYPPEIKTLIGNLKRLPGIGPRSAERIAVWLLKAGSEAVGDLAEALTQAQARVAPCQICGFFATEEICAICGDESRRGESLCIVEEATDILPLERTGAYRGLYHTLGGRISPLDNIGPEDLNLEGLWKRLHEGGFEEVILAVGSDVEGEATAHYLAHSLESYGVKITRLAQGLPAGGGLEAADDLTLFRALEGRTRVGEG